MRRGLLRRGLLFLMCVLLSGCQSCLDENENTSSSSTTPAPTESSSSRNAVLPPGFQRPFNAGIIPRDGGD